MKRKTITVDCPSCQYMKVGEDGNCTCSWGAGKPKRLLEQKGKKKLNCKLKR